jgi:outer membrane protein TolC
MKPAVAALAAMLAFLTPQGARALSVGDVLERVGEYDPSVRISGQSVTLTYNSLRRIVADAFPQIELSSGYSLHYKPEASIPNPVGAGADISVTDFGSSSLSTSLTLSQLLPTAGTLNLQLSHALDALAYETAGSAEVEYSQAPQLTLSLTQPLFFNSKIIDLAIFPATIRRGTIEYVSAQKGDRILRNEAVLTSLDLFFQATGLRRRIGLLERGLELQAESVTRLDRNNQLGLASEVDVWEARIVLGEQQEQLLDARHALERAEAILRISLGMETGTPIEGDETIPELGAIEARVSALAERPSELAETALSANPHIEREQLAVEQARLDRILDGINQAATMTASFSLFPTYPAVRTDRSLSASFSDLFSEDSEINYRISVGLRLPLYNGGKRTYERAVGLAAERIAAENLALSKATIRQELSALLLRKKNLEEKIVLLDDNVRLKRRRLEIERSRVDLGESTDFELSRVGLEVKAKENELWEARKDLFLCHLEMLSRMGQKLEELLLAGESQ